LVLDSIAESATTTGLSIANLFSKPSNTGIRVFVSEVFLQILSNLSYLPKDQSRFEVMMSRTKEVQRTEILQSAQAPITTTIHQQLT